MAEVSFDSTGLIIILAIFFAIVAVVTSVIYYFARYYFKTDKQDNEILTKKPVVLAPDLNAAPVDFKPAPTDLKSALGASQANLWGRLNLLFQKDISPEQRDEIEEVLYTSDLGPHAAEILLTKINTNLSADQRRDSASIRQALREEMLVMLQASSGFELNFKKAGGLQVWLVVGMNGVGKTTTIGKLASQARENGLKTLIVAGDTFRAAADAQLKAWADRAGCEIYSPENVKDPSAVAYSGMQKAMSENFDLVIVDTAGRLHTQEHLMEELKKIKRVLTKLDAQAPQQTLLVLDANAGQNAMQQARQFHEAVNVSAVIFTKLDGSSKAGVAIGISHELGLPISHIGVGESVKDLQPFNAKAFVEAIV